MFQNEIGRSEIHAKTFHPAHKRLPRLLKELLDGRRTLTAIILATEIPTSIASSRRRRLMSEQHLPSDSSEFPSFYSSEELAHQLMPPKWPVPMMITKGQCACGTISGSWRFDATGTFEKSSYLMMSGPSRRLICLLCISLDRARIQILDCFREL